MHSVRAIFFFYFFFLPYIGWFGVIHLSITLVLACHLFMYLFSFTQSGQTALWTAATVGNEQLVPLLLRKGANPSVESSRGDSLLQAVAVYRDDGVVLGQLFRAGADEEFTSRQVCSEMMSPYSSYIWKQCSHGVWKFLWLRAVLLFWCASFVLHSQKH